MRDFFILWMERIVNVVVVLGAVLVVVGAISMLFSPQGGFLAAIGILVGGAIYLILMAGMIYLGLGIYNNTRRTAEATERMAGR